MVHTRTVAEAAFRIAIVLVYIPFAVVRIYFRRKYSGQESSPGSVRGVSIGLVMAGVIGLMGGFVLFLFQPSWTEWDRAPLPAWLRWVAVGVGGLVWLPLWKIHLTLGRSYSAQVEIHADHELVTSGVYGRIRHPMYTVFLLFSGALAVIGSSWLMLISELVLLVGFHLLARDEEQMLIGTFGEAYRDYMKRSGRFLPRSIPGKRTDYSSTSE